MLFRIALAALIGAALVPTNALHAQEGPPRYERRWLYTQMNLQVAENADQLVRLIERARGAGYNGMVLADYKLNILDRVPRHYFANAARVREAAEKADIQIIPAIFPIGYSAGLLAHDPNLAEGLPVIDAPFVVRGREAQLDPQPRPILANADLEQARGDRFLGFNSQDDPGVATFADRQVRRQGEFSVRIEGQSSTGNRRLIQRVAVRPFACYRFSAWVKTKDVASPGAFRLLAIGAGQDSFPLTFFEGGVERTQDWRQVDVVFNSLNNDSINLYVGTWGTGEGAIWVDDLDLEELSLVNVLRRPGCPLKVTSEDGSVVYEEGRDFEPVADPKLGQVPYAGEYSFAHAGAALRLAADSRIRDGQRLRVSWHHPVLIHQSQVVCCLSEPKVDQILRDQVRRVKELLSPKAYFMSHDEIRVANWCQACRSRGMTPGELLADNARRCAGIIQKADPKAEIIVWSDMFDPHHNARDRYYLVNGSLQGAWEGLSSDVVIANWNGGKLRESLPFFAERGHRQILAGYYDVNDLSGFTRWDQAAEGVPGVIGFMYTTWRRKYDLLERYGEAMKARD